MNLDYRILISSLENFTIGKKYKCYIPIRNMTSFNIIYVNNDKNEMIGVDEKYFMNVNVHRMKRITKLNEKL